MDVLWIVLSGVAGLAIGSGCMVGLSKAGLNKNQQKAEQILKEAQNEAESRVKQAVLDGKTQAHDLRVEAEKEIKERKQESMELENKLLRREDNLNFRDEALNQKERQINEKMKSVADKLSSLDEKEKKLQEEIDKQVVVLESVAKMSSQAAKEELFAIVEKKRRITMTQNAPVTLHAIVDRIKTQKTILLPAFAISAFALVGYAAADRQAPVIHSNKIVVPYGTYLNASDFEITDNRDNLDIMDVSIKSGTYEAKQLGTYRVTVTVTDTLQNTTDKEVEVQVIDNEAPVIASRTEGGYIIDVEANGSNNLLDYVKATDNVDGDVTDFINFDKELDTTQLGEQVINASVEDNMGNIATKTFTFNVGDTSAPEMNLKNGNFVVNYGDNFDINNYVEAKDNYDMNPVLTVEGEVDTKKLDGTQSLKVTATDASGNKTENTYDVTVADIAAPAITLKSNDINVKYGLSFDAKSNLVSAIDNLDGDVTSKVNVSGSVNTSKAGSYTVNYTVTDNAGNTANASAKVTVAATPSRGGYNAGGTSVKGGHSGIVGTGLSKVGSAYVFGASGPTAFDCSGFTSWVYRQNGKSLPRTAAAQYSGTTRVSKDGLSAGDLVFFAGTYKSGISHVGIYIGNGQFVHAANSSTGVTVSSLNSGYYASHYAGAGR